MKIDVIVLTNNAATNTETLGGESTFRKRFSSAYVLPAATPSRSIRNSEQTAYLTPVLMIIPGRKIMVIADNKAFLVQERNVRLLPDSNNRERIRVAATTTNGAA
jgi:hypothetical protein